MYYLDAMIGDDNIFRKKNPLEDTGFTPVYFWKSKGRDTLEAILVASLVTSLFSIGLYAREFVMVSIWRDKIAKPKVDLILGGGNFIIWFWTSITGTFVTVFIVIGVGCGLMVWEEIILDFRSYQIVILEYLLMSIGKDLFSMRIFHPMMHRDWCQPITRHGIHHSFKDDTTAWSTLTIHPLDLALENTSGPALLLIAKFICLSIYNWQATAPTIHLAAYMFVSITDVSIHSANPYTVVFFNPILDWAMLPNVCHALHHVPKDIRETWDRQYFNQWPIHHLWPSNRQADVARYNQHFGTEFTFDIAPGICFSNAKARLSSVISSTDSVVKDMIAQDGLACDEEKIVKELGFNKVQPQVEIVQENPTNLKYQQDEV